LHVKYRYIFYAAVAKIIILSVFLANSPNLIPFPVRRQLTTANTSLSCLRVRVAECSGFRVPDQASLGLSRPIASLFPAGISNNSSHFLRILGPKSGPCNLLSIVKLFDNKHSLLLMVVILQKDGCVETPLCDVRFEAVACSTLTRGFLWIPRLLKQVFRAIVRCVASARNNQGQSIYGLPQ
jgi:hypothetical protein